MRALTSILGGLVATAVVAVSGYAASGASADKAPVEREDYERVPMPPGFQVVVTELEGAVFADAHGRTLYQWRRQPLRNGAAGDIKDGPSQCNDVVLRETVGLQSPWPAGLLLPDLDTRPSCAQDWPPVIASDKAKPVGAWTIIPRKDGKKQWAYDGYPVYTSRLDQQIGDVYGATKRLVAGETPPLRVPVGPPPSVPAGFTVTQMAIGRMLVTSDGYSVYSWDQDPSNVSKCDAACLKDWEPVLAAQSANAQGDWVIFDRSPGIRQWAFRGKPLYRRIGHQLVHSLEGGDVPGWHNVFTQRAPAPPKEFTVQDTLAGQVLADAQGKTIYVYNCGDDSADQLACDHPDQSQALRMAVCGHGDPEVCLKTFPPVSAPADAVSDSRVWTVMALDPKTGHKAAPGQAGALRVWAYRDRPVFTFAGDKAPGDIIADSWGEFSGSRNGYKAFWVREDYFGNAG